MEMWDTGDPTGNWSVVALSPKGMRNSEIIVDGEDVFSIGGRDCCCSGNKDTVMHYRPSTPTFAPNVMTHHLPSIDESSAIFK